MQHSYTSATRWVLVGLVLSLLGLAPAAAQQQPPITLLRDEAAGTSPLAATLTHARPLALDLPTARAALAAAPPEGQPGAAPLVLALPLPDGRTAQFAVRETALMAPALAAQFPAIRTYAGVSLDDDATLRLDLTPAGLHAQVLAGTGNSYILPARRGDNQHYLSFWEREVQPMAASHLSCGVLADKPEPATALQPAGPGGAPAAVSSGGILRTYRLAVAATGEYATIQGGTVAATQAAIVSTINFVSGILERTVAVRLQLVAGNSQIIYLDPNTDPYTNSSPTAMLDENQTNLDAVLGSGSYDIGHVFGMGGGGLAQVAGVCRLVGKARGYSGLSLGDQFEVRVVAHEMGHQFGAKHTFNSVSGSCTTNRNGSTAWEPGAGTTIMSYSGNCSQDNIQFGTDAMYHTGSFEQMRAFIETTTCATTTGTGNTPPTVRVPASGLTLPRDTPFRLTAFAQDGEADPLTYTWDELDLGLPGSLSASQVPENNEPLFRAFLPSNSPTRYFPQLSSLLANSIDVSERLPSVTRRLTFKCTVRDLHLSPAGATSGATSSDSVKLRVTSAAGPFVVTSPNTGLTWAGGSAQTVTWNVAGTTANGVNCALVDIYLSTDGGLTYPTLLARRVGNTGSALVTLPRVSTSQARVMVAAADNYFFDISNTNFAISSPSVCAPPTALTLGSLSTTSAVLSFAGQAGATQYVVTTTPATSSQTVAAGQVNLTGLTPGTAYTVQVVSNCTGGSSVAATVSFATPAAPLCSPPVEVALDGRNTTSATISFVPAASAVNYTISTVPATSSQTVTASPVVLTGLSPGTRYTVNVVSNCAGGATSAPTSLPLRTIALPPLNDACANALPLSCGVRVTGHTENSTSIGDPTMFCGTSVDGPGVLYTLRSAGGSITVSTCDPETDFDPKLFVYEGPCGGPYTCLGGNDDTNSNTCGQPPTVTFNSVSGHTYLIFVSGYGGETGFFGLLATCAIPNATAPAARATFEVAPNPAGSQAAFHLTLSAPAARATATLRNVLGQQVLQQRFAGRTTELPTAGLMEGTYLLTVEVAGQAPAVCRVVVE